MGNYITEFKYFQGFWFKQFSILFIIVSNQLKHFLDKLHRTVVYLQKEYIINSGVLGHFCALWRLNWAEDSLD